RRGSTVRGTARSRPAGAACCAGCSCRGWSRCSVARRWCPSCAKTGVAAIAMNAKVVIQLWDAMGVLLPLKKRQRQCQCWTIDCLGIRQATPKHSSIEDTSRAGLLSNRRSVALAVADATDDELHQCRAILGGKTARIRVGEAMRGDDVCKM